MKKITALLVAVLMVLGLAACGDSALSAAAGTYKGQYTKFVGDGEDAKNTDEEFTLVLEKNGKGTHSRNDLEIDVEWQLEGENFKMTETFMGMTIEYTGTLTGTTLDIFNGDPEDPFTAEYVYEKQ